jgi:hypothetical protein
VSTVTDPGAAQLSPYRLWGRLAVAATFWVALYVANRPAWDKLTYEVVGLDEDSIFGSAVHLFLFDATKIVPLSSGIIFVVTVSRSFVTTEHTSRHSSPTDDQTRSLDRHHSRVGMTGATT